MTAVAAAVAVLGLGAAPAGAAVPKRHANCTPKGAKAFAASERLRVFSVRNRSGGATGYACDMLNGKRRQLWRGTRIDSFSALGVRFAGTAVAFELRRCGKGGCSSLVESLEVAGGRLLYAEVQIGPVHDIVVTPTGAAAFIAGGSQPVVTSLTAAGAEQLDRGALVQPGSLALSRGRHVYWTNGVLPRSARLDDPLTRRVEPTSFGGHERCYPKRSWTEAASTRIRVYGRDSSDESDERYVACDLRSGRRTLLKQLYPDQESFGFSRVEMAGSFLAISTWYGAKGYSGEAGGMTSLDVATGAFGFSAPASNLWASVTSLVLEPDGSVGWITDARTYHGDPTPGPYTVKRCDATGCAQLEGGDDVDPPSMALSRGSHLYWTSGGQPRAATLD